LLERVRRYKGIQRSLSGTSETVVSSTVHNGGCSHGISCETAKSDESREMHDDYTETEKDRLVEGCELWAASRKTMEKKALWQFTIGHRLVINIQVFRLGHSTNWPAITVN